MGRVVGRYKLGRMLGSGNFSKVRIGCDTEDGSTWAVKIIDKKMLEREKMDQTLKREIAVLRKLRHPNIVHLHQVMMTDNHYYLVLEFVSGGELLDKILEVKRFDEPTARNYFHQLIAGIRYCHSKGFAHRDLKPENLLLDANGTLKITDFGLSNRQQDTLLQTVCGTPNYVAPEVLMERGYNGLSADIWSCGVVLYVMLAGRLPFDDPNMSALLAKIERGEYQMVRDVSDAVKDLIARMLIVDPKKRITLEGIIAHPWFQVDWVDIGLSLDGGSTTTCSEASSNFNGGSMCLPESLGAFELCCDAVESCECSVSGRDVRDDNNVALACVLGSRDDVNDASESVFLKTSMGSIETLFHLEGTVADVECALESVGGNPREKRPMELKGYIDAENGLLTYTAVITETDIPNVISVAIQRGRGDVSDFQYFYGQLLALVNSKLRSVTACVTNSTKYEVD